MTLSEILAAKAAKHASRNVPHDGVGSNPSPSMCGTEIVLTPEGPHYAKEIDSNGKFLKWIPKPKPLGRITIKADDEKAKLAASIKSTLDASAPSLPKTQPPAPRELGAMEPGERLPMDHPPQGAPDAAWEWFDSLHSFESDLGIVIDPKGEHAWLAVQAKSFEPPLLILRLPLLNRRLPGEPF